MEDNVYDWSLFTFRNKYLHVPSILEPVDEMSDTTSCMTKSINISSSDCSRSKRSFNISGTGSSSFRSSSLDVEHQGEATASLRYSTNRSYILYPRTRFLLFQILM